MADSSASNKIIKLKFQETSLSAAEAKDAETVGMMILASDYYGTKKVGKATKISRISKAYVPIYLAQTKTNGYIAMNPSSEKPMQLKITQLPDYNELEEFLNNPINLDLPRIHNKLTTYSKKDISIIGGVTQQDFDLIRGLVVAPREKGNPDFNLLPPTRPSSEIKKDVKLVDSAVYDEKRLDAEIKKRIDLVATKINEDITAKNAALKERESYWKTELSNLSKNQTAAIKNRQKQYDTDLKAITSESVKKKKKNIQQFVKGVAKNIRSDEKLIEKHVQHLEGLVQSPGEDPLADIEKSLEELDDAVEAFRAAVSFAKSNVAKTRANEVDIDHEANYLKSEKEKNLERDLATIKAEFANMENESEQEQLQLQQEVKKSEDKLNLFKREKGNWIHEIKSGVALQDGLLIEPNQLNISSPGKLLEIHIPMYIFKYDRNGDFFYVVIPPVKVPNAFKKVSSKNIIAGKHQSVYYIPMVDELTKFAAWFESLIIANQKIRIAVDALPNLVERTSDMRDLYFKSKSLMVDKLKMSEKAYGKATGRLTDIFA